MPSPSRETYQEYTTDSKLNTLYDLHVETIGLMERLGCRVDTVENGQKKWQIKTGGLAVGSGFLGGFTAMLLKLKFW